MAIKPVSPSLTYLNHLISLLGSKPIVIPGDFKSRVYKIKENLQSDSSGLVNSLTDFMISAATVDFSVESSNKKVYQVLNNWIININSNLRGKIPCGIRSLEKEYYRERWKNSSMIVLRTIWEMVDGYELPTKLWFVDGGDIEVESNSKSKIIGSEKYNLIVSKNDKLNLPTSNKEMIFVQKPFESWGVDYPTPFLVKRGILENSELLKLVINKGSNVINKAIEYLLLMKKGDPNLAKLGNPDFIYSEADLQKTKDDFQKMIDESNSGKKGSPTYTTNFDTDISHIIPEFEKVLDQKLYSPIERRILAGLGLIEVLEGISSSRKDSVLNPRAFISEVHSGVNDFKILLNDILMTIIEKNRSIHRKAMNADIISIRNSPITQFYSDDAKVMIRNLYDRGLVSKRTVADLCGSLDIDQEVERRKREQEEKLDSQDYPYVMYPPISMNQEATPDNPSSEEELKGKPSKKIDDEVLDDRKKNTPESKNFTNANLKKRGKK